MKTIHRRQLLATGLAGGVATAAYPLSSLGQGEAENQQEFCEHPG